MEGPLILKITPHFPQERVPQIINERPPPYFGRSDLETLMLSDRASDWVEITKRLLGPVPDDFNFTPKHKASAY